MMKTPDEIKKGLECCDFEHWQSRKCEQCPYMNADDEWCDSMDEIRSDAIAYIQQLEAENDNLRLSFAKQSREVAEHNLEVLKIVQQAVEKVPKWISVEERLPEERGNYLVRCYFRNPGATYVYENIKIIHFRGKTKWATENEYITHWMPLPEPPKEDDHEQDACVFH